MAENCDIECQKQKQLVLLKSAFDKAALSKEEDPATYQKARIAYYTLLNGQGWLQGEKQRIAEKEVKPVIQEYTSSYNSLKGEQQSQSMFSKLASVFKNQPDDKAYVDKLTTESGVLNRLNDLKSGTPEMTPPVGYLSIIVDVIIALLLIVVLYLGYRRFGSSFSTSSPVAADIVT